MKTTRKDRRLAAQARIAAELEQHGRDWNFADLRRREFADVPVSTWCRWLREIHESGVPANNAMRKARDQWRERVDAAGSPEVAKERLLKEVADELPASPAEQLWGLDYSEIVRLYNECLSDVHILKRHAQSATGGVRNAKLMLAASEHLRRTLDSMARTVEAAWEIGRLEKFFQVLFEQVRRRDPTLVQDIIRDLRDLNVRFGFDDANPPDGGRTRP